MRTPLMVAGFYDNVEAVKVLIASGDEVNAKDDVSGTMQGYCVILVLKVRNVGVDAIG